VELQAIVDSPHVATGTNAAAVYLPVAPHSGLELHRRAQRGVGRTWFGIEALGQVEGRVKVRHQLRSGLEEVLAKEIAAARTHTPLPLFRNRTHTVAHRHASTQLQDNADTDAHAWRQCTTNS
jgi:hypothetical protein